MANFQSICKLSGHRWGGASRPARSRRPTLARVAASGEKAPEIPHQWGDWKAVGRRCEERRACRHCGAERRGTGLEHQWSAWQPVKGRCAQGRGCRRCAQREEQALPHVWSAWEWLPARGGCAWRPRKCHICGSAPADTPARNAPAHHVWGEWQKLPDRCVLVRTCARCSKGGEASEHPWGGWRPSGPAPAPGSRACPREERRCTLCDRASGSPDDPRLQGDKVGRTYERPGVA